MGVPHHAPIVEHEAAYFRLGGDVVAALGALTECSSQLENEPLKGTVGRATLALVSHVESHCRELVAFLLNGLGSPEEPADVTYDKMWTLRSMGKRSELAQRWMLEAGAVAAVARAMRENLPHPRAQKEGVWLCYTLGGLDSVAELIQVNRCHLPSQTAAAWALYDIASGQREHGKVGTVAWPQADTLVLLMLEALRSPPQASSLDLLWACCSTLRELVEGLPSRGTLFVENGGDEAVLATLRAAQGAGDDGESVLVAAMQLIASLVEGNARVAHRLRARGAMDVLVSCGMRLPDQTMWTLGQIGGILPVLEVMSRAADSAEALQSGLAVLSRLAWKSTAAFEDSLQQQLPQAAEALATLARRVAVVERPIAELVMAIQALGGVVHMLAPHIAPGSWSVADDAIGVLVSAVKVNNDELLAQAAAASLGHVAASAPKWRLCMRGALNDLRGRMRAPTEREDSMKHQKNLFWACAAIAGLPAMVEEMNRQPNSVNVQDAALCAIVDILHGHADGETMTEDGEVCTELQQVPETIGVVAQAMRLHRTHIDIQWSGSHALGQLCDLLPVGQEVPTEAVESILTAIRRHPNEYRVASSTCSALRAFLVPRHGREGTSAVGQTVSTLRARDVGSLMRRVLEDYPATTDKILLEDILYVMGLVEGPQAVLQSLAATTASQVLMRCAGLKALVELRRAFVDFFPLSQLGELHAFVTALAAEAAAPSDAGRDGDLDEDNAEILRHAEILRGLVGCIETRTP